MPDLNTGIISPALPRQRSLTMSDFSTVTNVIFEFSSHHALDLKHVHHALKNVYSEPFTQETVAALFTDTNRTTIDSNALTVIRKEIIDLMIAASNAPDRATIANIIDKLPLSASCGKQNRRFPLRITAGITTAFKQQVAAKSTELILQLSTSMLFFDVDTFNPCDFKGISIKKFSIPVPFATSVPAPTAAAAAAAN